MLCCAACIDFRGRAALPYLLIIPTCAGKHASFLEQQALRSLAGGNVDAAVHRLGLCRDALLEEATASGHSPELCYRLGNVIGTQVCAGAIPNILSS